MYRDDLAKLSKDELIALVLAQAAQIAAQAAQIAALTRRIAEPEAKLGQPPKTPDNSSLPPSHGRKPNRDERRAAKRKGRPGVFRTLAANPDRIVESLAGHCSHCAHPLHPPDQPGAHAYDHIELPPIRPIVTRIHRHRGICPHCRRGFSAAPPPGMPPAPAAAPPGSASRRPRHDRRQLSR
jgi:transposase